MTDANRTMKKILLVEDDADIAKLYREELLRAGFEVQIAEDGLAAMRSLHQGCPDLVILDLLLPKLNGADVLKFIRTSPALKPTKVIIFSNTNTYMTDVALAAEKLGADAFLFKSRNAPDKLIGVINNLLAGSTTPADNTPGA